ncbi:MAG TPA: hypothetical protein H9727_00880, partial [Candidatus Borkfalkia avistercoris]|nr:hypothetical protein [Candidatus Borkfalkia avistercoris]
EFLKISHKKSDLSFPKDRSFSRLKVQFLYEFYFDFIPYGNCAFPRAFISAAEVFLSVKPEPREKFSVALHRHFAERGRICADVSHGSFLFCYIVTVFFERVNLFLQCTPNIFLPDAARLHAVCTKQNAAFYMFLCAKNL